MVCYIGEITTGLSQFLPTSPLVGRLRQQIGMMTRILNGSKGVNLLAQRSVLHKSVLGRRNMERGTSHQKVIPMTPTCAQKSGILIGKRDAMDTVSREATTDVGSVKSRQMTVGSVQRKTLHVKLNHTTNGMLTTPTKHQDQLR
jgi:hypothetical protein